MNGLMMERPLLISALLGHAELHHPEREVVSAEFGGGEHRSSWGEIARRSRRLASALADLGVRPGDRVATLALNTHRHLEATYAIAGLGAVCHTVNPRLDAEQLAYVLEHAGDVALLIDPPFLPLLGALADRVPGLKHRVVLADRAADGLLAYEDLVAAGDEAFAWPEFDERTASGLCYTSGTTGRPKGVLYSHRSTVLHAMAGALPDAFGLGAAETVLPVVPMFHVNAWGLPFAAALVGAKLVLPADRLDGARLAELLDAEAVTFTAGVPTIWHNLLTHLAETGRTLPALQRVACGGSAVPPSMIEAFEVGHGVTMCQGWGMTETSPLGAVGSLKPGMADLNRAEQTRIKAAQGRALFGLEWKIAGPDGAALPWDGESAGELLVRGNWVAAGYLDHNEDVLRDGWFPTGDIACVDPAGYLRITDRVKDVIKSGGEWISSVALENAAMGHPDVAQAAVVGVPDAQWGERPVLFVQPPAGVSPDVPALLAHLAAELPQWWVPERVEIVDALPLGPTGKILKRELRAQLSGPS
jgi:3-(methylthio)propionyl---CoA ligase